jgi:hypothetical protein
VPLSRGELAIDRQRIVGDLISYQNDRKGCAMIADKVENVSEHAAACIGMLTDQ